MRWEAVNRGGRYRPSTADGTAAPYVGALPLVLLIAVQLLVFTTAPAQAQDRAAGAAELPDVRVVIDDDTTSASENLRYADPSRQAEHVVDSLRRQGYYLAEIQAIERDTSEGVAITSLYVNRGPEVPLGELTIQGVDEDVEAEIRREMSVRVGSVLQADDLEADIEQMLGYFEEIGYPLVQVEVARLQLSSDPDPHLELELQVNLGDQLVFGGIVVEEGTRSSPTFLARLLDLRPDELMKQYDLDALRDRLESSDLFDYVGELEVEISGGRALLHLPLDEAGPGVFDLALGYQPDEYASGRLVGSGHLNLRNPFGGGRVLSLRLDQRPGHFSQLRALVRDPYVLNTPFSIGAAFEGRQQDSTYNRQRYQLDGGYEISTDMRAYLSVERITTQPGVAGSRLTAEGPVDHHSPSGSKAGVARTSATLFGAGFTFNSTGLSSAPRRGFYADVHVARGYQARERHSASGGTPLLTHRIPQEHASITVRGYVPVGSRQVVVGGMDGEMVLSEAYDAADLVQLGGARSLRGYDEDQFAGWMAGRLLAEYRLMLGRRAYAYGFGDLGYAREPESSIYGAREMWLPGFGAGVQLDTQLGLFSLMYALNDRDSLMDGRLHMFVSIAL